MHSPNPVAPIPGRDRVIITGCILLVTALAWAYLLHLGRQMSSSAEETTMMARMGMAMDESWSARDVFLTFLMWSVMMVGMMSTAATPMLLLFARMRTGSAGGVPLHAILFGLGYLAIWLGFSAAAALAQWSLHEAALLSAQMALGSPYLAGAVLVAAGAYQLSPVKSACLTQCRSPLGFLMSHWRDGSRGALEMGLRHGVYCLGCCWALMGVLFAVGIMNLAWVALLSVFILIEKVAWGGGVLARVGGVTMVVFGVVILVRG